MTRPLPPATRECKTEDQIILAVIEIIYWCQDNVSTKIRMPNVTFYRNDPTSCGKCTRDAQTLKFNLDYAESYPDRFFETIQHEIGHVMQITLSPNAKQNHGPEFRRYCKLIGNSGSTYNTFVKRQVAKRQTRYTYVCSSTCEQPTHKVSAVRHNRVKLGKVNYTCTLCNTRITFKPE